MAFVIIRAFLKRETDSVKGLLFREAENRKLEMALKVKDITLPIRLQAYERMTLFCSRIELGQLILRISGSQGMSANKLKILLINAVDEEFNHNVTQQMYMSEELWEIISLARKEAVKIVTIVYKSLEVRASGKEFVEAFLEYSKEAPQQGYLQAQVAIKKEVALLF
ncbi:MAG: hypothetical protein GY810_22895 [Aureispira sp.]|nr:hypothetical protein [Aureispira sp.]